MTKSEMMTQYVLEHYGHLTLSEIQKMGISKTYAMEYIRKHGMEKIARGVYVSDETWPDDLYLLHLRNKGIVFSHETALALHGLSERESPGIMVTVKRSYNATHLRQYGCTVYAVTPELHHLGLTSLPTSFGNPVPVYDLERTICDIIKHQKKIEIQAYQAAIRGYMQRKEKNLPNLMHYAEMLGITEKVRTYTEVML